jgi:hypothetical protein
MKESNISKQIQQFVQDYQTNRKEDQEAHTAKQHNHSQSNQETKIQNNHSNKHNKPKQACHQHTNKRKLTTISNQTSKLRIITWK